MDILPIIPNTENVVSEFGKISILISKKYFIDEKFCSLLLYTTDNELRMPSYNYC